MDAIVHFTDEDWARAERDWSAWWAGELDRPLVWINHHVPPADGPLPEAPHFATNLPMEMPAEELVARYAAHFACRRFHGDAVPKWWPNFGPGVAAAFLGAPVRAAPDTAWFEPAHRGSIRDLTLRYDPDARWWRRLQDVTRAAVQLWGSSACVCQTDLGGNLDILASLRTTEQLLLDVVDEPEEVARCVAEVTRLWLRYYRELDALIAPAGRGTSCWAGIWSPRRCYMLQCDFGYMISPKMYERFVMPDLEACCAFLDHGFYHLDGRGQIAHVDLLLSLDRLRGIQWVPGAGQPDTDHWLPLLRRIRDGGKLCYAIVNNTAGARAIVRALGGKGFVLHIREQLNAEDSAAFLRVLAEDDRRR